MSISAADMASRLRRELKDEDASNYSPEELYDYINGGTRAVARKIFAVWPAYYLRTGETQLDTQDIVSGTANYNLPTRFLGTIVVTVTDSDGDVTELKPISFVRGLDSDAEGYYLLNEDIYIFPEPTASVASGLNHYYVQIPAAVRGSTAVPFSDDWEDEIQAWVALKAKARQEEKVADFGAVFKKIESELSALMVRTNKGEDEGLLIPWRNWL